MSIIEKNTVPAKAQTASNLYVVNNHGNCNVLFAGNSITWHEPKPEIGWTRDCGMAASAKEKDYVHRTVKLLEEKYGKINYAVVNCSSWERAYYNDEALGNYSAAQEFPADILVVRLGENMWSAHEYFSSIPLAPQFEKLIDFLCGERKSKVVITDLFWKNQTIDRALRFVAAKKGYSFVSINDLGDDQENMAIGQFAHEGVCLHPSDNGMEKIAQRLAKAILE